jgi:hypothetical protein
VKKRRRRVKLLDGTPGPPTWEPRGCAPVLSDEVEQASGFAGRPQDGGVCAPWWVWWASNVGFMLFGAVLGSLL